MVNGEVFFVYNLHILDNMMLYFSSVMTHSKDCCPEDVRIGDVEKPNIRNSEHSMATV